MKKLKAVVKYECMTSFKYIWLFYAIQYAIVTLIMLMSCPTNGQLTAL